MPQLVENGEEMGSGLNPQRKSWGSGRTPGGQVQGVPGRAEGRLAWTSFRREASDINWKSVPEPRDLELIGDITKSQCCPSENQEDEEAGKGMEKHLQRPVCKGQAGR